MKDPILDKRYVYGFCTWHDTIHKASSTGPQKMIVNGRRVSSPGLPCCPYCGSMLMEVPTKESWDKGVDDWDKKYPGYKKYVEWSQGKCFPTLDVALMNYNKATNNNFTRDDFGFKK